MHATIIFFINWLRKMDLQHAPIHMISFSCPRHLQRLPRPYGHPTSPKKRIMCDTQYLVSQGTSLDDIVLLNMKKKYLVLFKLFDQF